MSNPDPQTVAAKLLIVGIILAAGMSQRLGRPKQLLDLAGKALVAHVADAALASNLDHSLVVIGHEADAVKAALGDRMVRFCRNSLYAGGQSTSLRRALETLPQSTDAVVILLADQPTIDSNTIDRVIDERRDRGASIVMTRYGKTRSHPILFGRELFGEIRAIEGDRGARDVIRHHQERVVAVDGGQDEPPPDVDTEKAYESLKASWRNRFPDAARTLG